MFDALAERKILEAQARGEFDALPGADRPPALSEPRYYVLIVSRLG